MPGSRFLHGSCIDVSGAISSRLHAPIIMNDYLSSNHHHELGEGICGIMNPTYYYL